MKKPGSEFSYKPGTIEAQGQPEGGRDLSIYEKTLNFDRHELDGKMILDLGAGPEVKFTRELKMAGINAEVMSLSPDFSEEKYSKKAREVLHEGELVAAIGQKLPFKNESFDRIFALHVLHVREHVSEEAFFDIIQEAARTLKRGGQAKLGPMLNVPGMLGWLPYKAILSNETLKDYLDSQGVEVIKEDIPLTVIPRKKMRDMGGDFFYEQSFNIVLTKKKNELDTLESAREELKKI